MSSSKGPTLEEAERARTVIESLKTVKEIVVSGLRCPNLVAKLLQKMPPDQSSLVLAASNRIRCALLDEGNGSGVSMIGGSFERKSSDPSLSKMNFPYSSSPPPSPTSPRSPKGLNKPLSPRGKGQKTSAHGEKNMSLFRKCVLGATDTPNDAEVYPRPITPGLIHEDTRPLYQLLLNHKELNISMYEVLKESSRGTYDALYFANMMWIQTHPPDIEAAAIESTRLAASRKSSSGVGSSPQNNGSDGSQITTPKASLESRMKKLLMLNLTLKYDSELWAPWLQVRDRAVLAAHDAKIGLTEALAQYSKGSSGFGKRSKGVSAHVPPSYEKGLSGLETLGSSLGFLSIHSSPAELQTTIFDRLSGVSVEMGFIAHDHGDIKDKKLLEAFETHVGGFVDDLKAMLMTLTELPMAAEDHHELPLRP